MDKQLFSKVFNHKYLGKNIFEQVSEIQQDKNSLHYEEIKDIVWMVKNKHYTLFKEKLRNNELVSINSNLNVSIMYTILKAEDKEVIVELYERYKEVFPIEDVIKICIQFSLIIPIQALGQRGYLSYGKKEWQNPFSPKGKVDPEVLKCLIEYNYFEIESLDAFKFSHTPETLKILLDSIKVPFNETMALQLLNLIIKSRHQSILNAVPQEYLHVCSEVVSKLRFASLQAEFRDPNLFIFILENHTLLTPDQRKAMSIRILTNKNQQHVEIIKYLLDVDQMPFYPNEITLLISSCFENLSKPLLDYILDEWRPNLRLDDIHLESEMYSKSKKTQVKEFYQFEFIDKLLDRGFDLFKYWIIQHSQEGTTDIFMMLWNKFAPHRVRVQGRILFRTSEAADSQEQDITIELLRRCFITCNLSLLKFLISQGYTFQEEDTNLWNSLHFKLENTYEFTKYLVEIGFPQNESAWDDLLNEMFYDSLDERLFKLAIERAMTFPDFQVDSYLGYSIAQNDLDKLKTLYQLNTFDLTNNFSVIEKVLAKSNLEIIKFLSEKFHYLDTQIHRDSFIKHVIASDNFILLKYIATHFNKKFESLDSFYESLGKCTCPAIVDYVASLCPSIDYVKLKKEIQSENRVMLDYVNKILNQN
ncbi:hypothetical protein CYY_010543 [Polysphondylium violaceum]|uniref:Uncharacterized protein n=1 Tax=Polysphondylium violaceum TaxID=133409 RepID=A0A8J4UUZ5_9MYCE|nr:hypothetical protein CYY_010543 [Polysphondylium violaceum]